MTFKVRRGRKEVILPRDAHALPDVDPRRPIVVALVGACKWQEMLDSPGRQVCPPGKRALALYRRRIESKGDQP